MFSGADAPWHWLILIILVVALFGYKKLPDAARSLGRSLRIFKTEIKGMTEDDAARDARANAPTTTTVAETNMVKQAPVVDSVRTVDAAATHTASTAAPSSDDSPTTVAQTTASSPATPTASTPTASAPTAGATTPGTV